MVNNLTRSLEKNEEIISLKVLYLNVIKALVYLANCTRPDIAFIVNLLVRHNSTLIKKIYWNNPEG